MDLEHRADAAQVAVATATLASSAAHESALLALGNAHALAIAELRASHEGKMRAAFDLIGVCDDRIVAQDAIIAANDAEKRHLEATIAARDLSIVQLEAAHVAAPVRAKRTSHVNACAVRV